MELTAYDDLESMFDAIRRASESADTRVKPWQAAIKPGDHFIRDSQLGFPIYGEILDEDDPRDPHLRHYRLCRAYSIACSEGELGDIHVSTIDALLTAEEFQAARVAGWLL